VALPGIQSKARIAYFVFCCGRMRSSIEWIFVTQAFPDMRRTNCGAMFFGPLINTLGHFSLLFNRGGIRQRMGILKNATSLSPGQNTAWRSRRIGTRYSRHTRLAYSCLTP
jgi:hypothetical protein